MAFYTPYPTYPLQNQQQGIIWVQGEQAAKSYLIAPNTTVPLWDSEQKKIYLKTADPSGMPSMKVLEYTIIGEEAQKEYATKDDLKELADKIRSLKDEFQKLTEADHE